MSCNCHGQSCENHGNHMQSGCGCSCKSNSCSCKSCSGESSCCSSGCGSQKNSCESEGCKDHAHKLLCLADMAWMEVLKEKMKEHIRANDHKIDEMAKIVCEVNHERWKRKMSEAQCCTNYEEKLKNLIKEQCNSGHCQTSNQQGNGKPQENGNENKGFLSR